MIYAEPVPSSATRIERQYEATEPENRLVAAELEKRWNAAIAHVVDLEARLADAQKKTVPLGEGQRQQLLMLGEDLEQLWDHPACPVSLKKRILRTVLKEIIATEVGDPTQIFLKLHWAGGVHTELVLRKNQTGHQNRVNSREVIDLVRELAQVCDDSAIVGILNRLGYRTGTENTWNEKRLQHVRHSNGIPRLSATGAAELGNDVAGGGAFQSQFDGGAQDDCAKDSAGATGCEVRSLDDRTHTFGPSRRA